MATAVYIKSESCDEYLYVFPETFTEQEARHKAAVDCPEHPDHWDTFLIETN